MNFESSERPIKLQARGSKSAKPKPQSKDPVEALRNNIRGAMVIQPDDARSTKDDYLYPNLWSTTAYDSLKHGSLTSLQKVAQGLVGSAVGAGAALAGLPGRAALALARRAGIPVDELTSNPEQLQEIVRVMSDLPGSMRALTGQESSSGEFLPRGFKRAADMTEKEKFLRENMDGFRELEKIAREESLSSMRKAAFFGPFRTPTMGEQLGKAIAGGVDSMKDVVDGVKGTDFGKWVGSNPGIAGGLAGAGAVGAGVMAKHIHNQAMSQGSHDASYTKALDMFPELKEEDPEKVQMLWRSALHVAPNMSKNPMLLGTWMKGLARGYEGTHLSTEDLKRLQDLEVAHVGQAPKRNSGLGIVGDVAQTGSNIASIFKNMNGGR